MSEGKNKEDPVGEEANDSNHGNNETLTDDQQGEDKSSNEREITCGDEKADSKSEDVTTEIQESTLNPEALERLTLGFLSHCLPDLQKAKGSLTEILTNQKVLQETVHNENSKFRINEDIDKTMAKTKFYHSKLLYLKREMNNLGEKSFKLKKRGIKLQQQKTSEEIKKKEQEEREKIREEMLTAKVAKKRSNSQSDKS